MPKGIVQEPAVPFFDVGRFAFERVPEACGGLSLRGDSAILNDFWGFPFVRLTMPVGETERARITVKNRKRIHRQSRIWTGRGRVRNRHLPRATIPAAMVGFFDECHGAGRVSHV